MTGSFCVFSSFLSFTTEIAATAPDAANMVAATAGVSSASAICMMNISFPYVKNK